MESKEGIVSVKQETNYTWPDKGDDFVSNSADPCKIENVDVSPSYKTSYKYITPREQRRLRRGEIPESSDTWRLGSERLHRASTLHTAALRLYIVHSQ
ncbi:unnamed protein product [Trichogramma brassicae]|uniref:Uncharacterized protein n=1 Tax=Trichogramma brassicae TaxID=86971 RepID=A0A6H5II05_9HYME|nr:unnamed protein product [Trichogramma brassicae]